MRGAVVVLAALASVGAVAAPLPDLEVPGGQRERTPSLEGRSSRGDAMRRRSPGKRQKRRRKAARRGGR